MEAGTIAAILGILIGVWVLQTAVPYFIKKRKEDVVFSFKFVVSGLVTTMVMALPMMAQEIQLFVIVEGVHPGWIFLGALISSGGMAGYLNRYGITAWIPKKLQTVLEAQTETESS